MKLIINDKRYAALKSLGEKKQCFNEYLQQRKKGEKEEERQRLKRAKEACFWKICFSSKCARLLCFIQHLLCCAHLSSCSLQHCCMAGKTIRTCISL